MASGGALVYAWEEVIEHLPGLISIRILRTPEQSSANDRRDFLLLQVWEHHPEHVRRSHPDLHECMCHISPLGRNLIPEVPDDFLVREAVLLPLPGLIGPGLVLPENRGYHLLVEALAPKIHDDIGPALLLCEGIFHEAPRIGQPSLIAHSQSSPAGSTSTSGAAVGAMRPAGIWMDSGFQSGGVTA